MATVAEGKNDGRWGGNRFRSTVCQMFMQMRPYETRAYNAANARGKQRESFSEAGLLLAPVHDCPKEVSPPRKGKRERWKGRKVLPLMANILSRRCKFDFRLFNNVQPSRSPGFHWPRKIYWAHSLRIFLSVQCDPCYLRGCWNNFYNETIHWLGKYIYINSKKYENF